jgi:cytochrome c
MRRHQIRSVAAAGALAWPAIATAQDFHALVFTRTLGWRHESIATAVATVQTLAAEHCFAVTHTEDPAVFSAAGLAPYDVVIFLLTSGDVLDPAQQAAFEAWWGPGRGWVGVHSAADTEYLWPFYQQLVVGHFFDHPLPQQASIYVEDGSHPSTGFLPQRPQAWVRYDEWYDYTPNPRGTAGVRVLLTLDESTYTGGQMGADHPIAWCHEPQGGRAWYTGGGHTWESYYEPLFVRHVLGGILWAAGRESVEPYANCDGSTAAPILNVADFTCFLQRYAAGDAWANCDGSTAQPALNVADFSCFLQRFASGCP